MTLIKYEDIFEGQIVLPSTEEPVVHSVFWMNSIGYRLTKNILIVGRADIGRTAFLNRSVFLLISQYQPDDVRLWLYDANLCAFKDFSGCEIPHIKLNSCEDDANPKKVWLMRYSRRSPPVKRCYPAHSLLLHLPHIKRLRGQVWRLKGVAFLNFGETFFRKLHNLPPQYIQKFSEIVRVSTVLDICIILCIQEYAHFLLYCFPTIIRYHGYFHSGYLNPCFNAI